MPLSPDNRVTLETLLAGLNSGVSGSAVAPILNATLAAQQSQQDARMAKYQDMAQSVAGMASQGMPMGATENYVDMMTRKSGIPGKFQGLIDTAYSGADVPDSLAAEYPNFMVGSEEYNTEIAPQLQSPMFTDNPASAGAYNIMADPSTEQFGGLLAAPEQAQQMAMMEMPAPAEPTDADLMGQVQAGITQYINNGMSPEEIAANIAADPTVMGVVMDNMTTFMQTAPEVMQALAPSGY